MQEFDTIYTVPQVMVEVSNLTDLGGNERLLARAVLRQVTSTVTESDVTSGVASAHPLFMRLGLTDEAIATAAREHNCVVLTDDLPLYVWLAQAEVSAINYTHLRERFQII